jgi:hypothetical protein
MCGQHTFTFTRQQHPWGDRGAPGPAPTVSPATFTANSIVLGAADAGAGGCADIGKEREREREGVKLILLIIIYHNAYCEVPVGSDAPTLRQSSFTGLNEEDCECKLK